mmetsp:Transcript_44423/g.137106  ORF Transcript_44423/g.137106 Transcript_44423/m.137106 type:complete len:296 (+) Transcript_44423:483-1370(+)
MSSTRRGDSSGASSRPSTPLSVVAHPPSRPATPRERMQVADGGATGPLRHQYWCDIRFGATTATSPEAPDSQVLLFARTDLRRTCQRGIGIATGRRVVGARSGDVGGSPCGGPRVRSVRRARCRMPTGSCSCTRSSKRRCRVAAGLSRRPPRSSPNPLGPPRTLRPVARLRGLPNQLRTGRPADNTGAGRNTCVSRWPSCLAPAAHRILDAHASAMPTSRRSAPPPSQETARPAAVAKGGLKWVFAPPTTKAHHGRPGSKRTGPPRFSGALSKKTTLSGCKKMDRSRLWASSRTK